jgi:hypothetical protein
MRQADEDLIIATADLANQAGAESFEIGWGCDHIDAGEDILDGHHCPSIRWEAIAFYDQVRAVGLGDSPASAAAALVKSLLKGSACRCGKLAKLDGVSKIAKREVGRVCMWRLDGREFVSGCSTDPDRGRLG